MLKGKKADAPDVITFLIVIFFLAVSFIVVTFVVNQLKSVITDTALNDTSPAADIVAGIDNMTTNTINKGFLLLFGFLIIGEIASAFMIKIHPVFLFIWIIFAGVGIFLGVFLGNAYQSLIAVDAFAEIAAKQTMINWVMEHIVMIMLGVAGLSMVVLFAKIPGSEGF